MVTNLGHQCHHHEGHDYLSGVFVLPCCPGMTSGIMWRTYRRKDPPNPIAKNTNPSHARWRHELCNFPQEMFALIGREETVCWTLLPAVGWLNHTSKEFKAQFPCTSMYVKGLWLIASLSLTTCFDLRHRCCLATITFAGCSAQLRFLEVTSCQLLTTGNLSVYIQAVPMFSKFLDIEPGYLKFPPRPPKKHRYILWPTPSRTPNTNSLTTFKSGEKGKPFFEWIKSHQVEMPVRKVKSGTSKIMMIETNSESSSGLLINSS